MLDTHPVLAALLRVRMVAHRGQNFIWTLLPLFGEDGLELQMSVGLQVGIAVLENSIEPRMVGSPLLFSLMPQ
jgi:hypothetical protein